MTACWWRPPNSPLIPTGALWWAPRAIKTYAKHRTTWDGSTGYVPIIMIFLPAAARDQRNVDSPSAAVRGAAGGLIYRYGQMAVAKVDLRLVSAVARPPTTVMIPSTRLLLGGGLPHYHYPRPPLLKRSYKPRHAAGLLFLGRLFGSIQRYVPILVFVP